MSNQRNPRYRRRKSIKKARGRKAKRRRCVIAAITNIQTLALLESGMLPLEVSIDLVYPTRLQHMKKAARQVNWHLTFPDKGRIRVPPKVYVSDRYNFCALPACPTVRPVFPPLPMIKSIKPAFFRYRPQNIRSLGGYLQCSHHSTEQTLRVFPSPDGTEVYFRCHLCGETLSGVEYYWRKHRTLMNSIEEAAIRAYEEGMYSQPLSAEAVAAYGKLHKWRNTLDRAREYYDLLVRNEKVRPKFGDWAAFDRAALVSLLHGIKIPVRGMWEVNLASVQRNAFGFPAVITLYSTNYEPWLKLRFSDDQLLFNAPRWADFSDWSSNLIVCPDDKMALAVWSAVADWSPGERVGVVTVARPGLPPPSALSSIWIPIQAADSAEYGLPFCGTNTTVRVKRFSGLPAAQRSSRSELCNPALPECLDLVVSDLGRDARPIAPLLSTVLSNPHVPSSVGKELIARCGEAGGVPPEILTAAVDPVSAPYAVCLGSNRYLCREDVFLKRSRRGNFEPITNFRVQILGEQPHRKENPLLQLKLTVAGAATNLEVTNALFDNSKRLWNAIRGAAKSAGLAYPMMFSVPDRKLLPELIRAMSVGA